MNCQRASITSKRYTSRCYTYRGVRIVAHPSAGSSILYGVQRPGERKFFAGPFRTAAEAEAAIDADLARRGV